MPKQRKARDAAANVNRDTPAYRVIWDAFGGLQKFHEATGIAKSTAYTWLYNDGLVPADRIPHIRARALALKVKLPPEWFVPAPAEAA